MSRGLGALQRNVLKAVSNLEGRFGSYGATPGHIAEELFTIESGLEPTYINIRDWMQAHIGPNCGHTVTEYANKRGVYRAVNALAGRGLLREDHVFELTRYTITEFGKAKLTDGKPKCQPTPLPDTYQAKLTDGTSKCQGVASADTYQARRSVSVVPDAYKRFDLSVSADLPLTFIEMGGA